MQATPTPTASASKRSSGRPTPSPAILAMRYTALGELERRHLAAWGGTCPTCQEGGHR